MTKQSRILKEFADAKTNGNEELANKKWEEYILAIRSEKPKGTKFNYEAVMKVLKSLLSNSTESHEVKLKRMLAMLDSSANEVYKYPVINGEAK